MYTCTVSGKSNFITDKSNRNIDSTSGAHQSSKSNDNKLGVWITSSTCHYAPIGLEKYFKNLEGFAITGSGLKELKQADLKNYPNLISVEFNSNNLEVLEAGLFDYNPKLIGAYFHVNKISKIDSRVFDNFVNKMNKLTLSNNVCQLNGGSANELIATIQSGYCNSAATQSTTEEKLQEKLDEITKKLTEELTKKFEDELKNVQNSLEIKIAQQITELKQNITNDKNKCGSCSENNLEERVKFIENAMGIERTP